MSPPRTLQRSALIATLLSALLTLSVPGLKAVAPEESTPVGLRTRDANTAVSSAETLKLAEQAVKMSNELAERASKMLDEARKEKDAMRVNGINRVLTEARANSDNIAMRARALQDAIAAGDDARVGHEHTVLTVLSQQLSALDQKLTQVIGQSTYEPGASQNTKTNNGNTPGPGDLTEPNGLPGGLDGPLPPAPPLEDQLRSALAADPDNAAKIVADFVKKNPGKAADIVKWAVTALPNKAVDITKAAVNAAPENRDAIIKAATDAAPGSKQTILDATSQPGSKSNPIVTPPTLVDPASRSGSS